VQSIHLSKVRLGLDLQSIHSIGFIFQNLENKRVKVQSPGWSGRGSAVSASILLVELNYSANRKVLTF
jgi:hypothetical protein